MERFLCPSIREKIHQEMAKPAPTLVKPFGRLFFVPPRYFRPKDSYMPDGRVILSAFLDIGGNEGLVTILKPELTTLGNTNCELPPGVNAYMLQVHMRDVPTDLARRMQCEIHFDGETFEGDPRIIPSIKDPTRKYVSFYNFLRSCGDDEEEEVVRLFTPIELNRVWWKFSLDGNSDSLC